MGFGSIIIDLAGTKVSSEERKLLQHKNTAGVLLFSRNFESIEQLILLTQEIRDLAGKPVLICVDHEGGRIWRFKSGFICPPSMRLLGEIYEHDPSVALEQAKNTGWIIAAELLACGVDLTLAPVLDLDQGISQVIGDRAFHSNPNIIIKIAREFINGLHGVGMAAVGKHFPGHGSCSQDTHKKIVIDPRAFKEISPTDLLPFQELSSVLQAIMPAHVCYPAIDKNPAGFSSKWLQNILRKQLCFNGAIISDCISMQGVHQFGSPLERCHAALNAGCDLVICAQQSRAELLFILNNLAWEKSNQHQERIENLVGNFKHPSLKKPLPELADVWSADKY